VDAGVKRNEQLRRFELEADGAAAVAYYELTDGVMNFSSTQVPASLRNRGIASRLIEGALDLARADGLKVTATCSFVRDFLERRTEYADMRA
jgi:predicted GNAT family acetyltransferase